MAVDRKTLVHLSEGKTARWPRTSRRQERIETVLRRRQPDLTVVLEDVHDPHNASAVLRGCDAAGVARIHLVYDREEAPAGSFARTTSGSAAKWIEIARHDSIADCYERLRLDGFRIAALALHETSVDLYDCDLRQPIALVFGNEMRGLSRAAIDGADLSIVLPMMGMVESLNIAVASAVVLYEALRQRRAAGAYETPKLSEEELGLLREEWLRR